MYLPAAEGSCKEWALYYLSLGLRPLPVTPGRKFPAVKWEAYQTREPTMEEIESWDWSGGVGTVTNGLVLVDCDKGGEALLKDKECPPSWTVRTGSGGLHRHFRGNGTPTRNAVALLKGENGAQVDIRADGGFVILPPTQHVDTGKRYEWLLPPGTIELAPAPAWILDALAARDQPKVAGTNTPPWVAEALRGVGKGQRNATAARLAGYFARKQHPEDITFEILRPFGERCIPPLSEREIQHVITSTYRTHRRRGGDSSATPDLATVPEELPAEAPEGELPAFPEIAYQGLTAEIAETYAQYLETPKEFLYVDALTFLGALLATKVRLDSELREEPRLFNIKVAPSWSGRKSSAQETIERFYDPLLQNRVTLCHGAGSAEGLQRVMQSELPTVLVYDEFRAFADKAGVQQSVLLPMVASLFHRTKYENSTKNSEIRLTNAHLSLIGACTTETFVTMFSPQFRNIGFLNRLFVVAGRRQKLHPIPRIVPHDVVARLQAQTKAQLERAEQEKPALRFTPDAQTRWEDWYRSMPDTPYVARLDTYGLRFLMLFAVTTGSWQITRVLVDAVIPLLEYQLAIRRELDPVDAEGVVARLERMILRQLAKGRMPESRLQARCNVRYYGLWAYDLALRNIHGHEWVKVEKAGKGRQLWLTEAGREAVSQ